MAWPVPARSGTAVSRLPLQHQIAPSLLPRHRAQRNSPPVLQAIVKRQKLSAIHKKTNKFCEYHLFFSKPAIIRPSPLPTPSFCSTFLSLFFFFRSRTFPCVPSRLSPSPPTTLQPLPCKATTTFSPTLSLPSFCIANLILSLAAQPACSPRQTTYLLLYSPGSNPPTPWPRPPRLCQLANAAQDGSLYH